MGNFQSAPETFEDNLTLAISIENNAKTPNFRRFFALIIGFDTVGSMLVDCIEKRKRT